MSILDSMTREQLIERAQLLKQAQALQASKEAVDPPIPSHGPLDTVGDAVTKVIDYSPGYLRTGLGTAQGLVKEAITGDDSAVPTLQDWMDTVKGHAPTMLDYNTRMGMSKGLSISDVAPKAFAPKGAYPGKAIPEKGGALDWSARGVFSGLEDMLLSPSLVMRAGKAAKSFVLPDAPQTAVELRAAEKAARDAAQAKASQVPIAKGAGSLWGAAKSILMGTPISDAAEAAGSSMYRQPFAKADVSAMTEGKGPRAVSKLAMDNGIWGGSSEGLESRLRDLLKQKGSEIKGIEDANRSKVALPFGSILNPAMEQSLDDAFSLTPQRQAVGARIYNELGEVGQKNPEVPLDRLIQYKRDQQKLADSMKQYGDKVVMPDPAGNAVFEGPLREKNASSVTRAIEDAFDEAQPGSGGKYHKANSEYGVIRDGLPGMNADTKSEMLRYMKPEISDLPFVGAALGVHQTPEAAILGYLGAKVAKSPLSLTGGGLALNRVGQWGLLDPIVRESLLQKYGNHGTSPWSLLNKQEKKK